MCCTHLTFWPWLGFGGDAVLSALWQILLVSASNANIFIVYTVSLHYVFSPERDCTTFSLIKPAVKTKYWLRFVKHFPFIISGISYMFVAFSMSNLKIARLYMTATFHFVQNTTTIFFCFVFLTWLEHLQETMCTLSKLLLGESLE